MVSTTVFDPTGDGTLRPNEKPISKRGTCFQPMILEDHDIEISLPEGVSAEDPYTLFELYYSLEIIESIVEATNSYDRKVPDKPRARGKDWYPTTNREIYLYMAVRIYMTIHIENEISDYWSTSKDDAFHPCSVYLPKDRFLELHIKFRLTSDTSTAYARVCDLFAPIFP